VKTIVYVCGILYQRIKYNKKKLTSIKKFKKSMMKKEKFLMEKIQKIIILKKELKNYLVKRYRIPKNRFKVINKLNKRLIVLFKTKY